MKPGGYRRWRVTGPVRAAEMRTAAERGVATMRAGVITGPGRARVDRVALPEPARGQVRLRLEGCGVCGSNLPVWEGRPWFEYPLQAGAPGHEGWGVVDAVGPGVVGLAPGERVAALSSRAFAEYDLAEADTVAPLPAALAGQPVPGEPLGCAMNVFRRAEIGPEDTVVVIGIGFLGAVVTRLASRAGARVVAVSRRPFALEVARSQGAEIVLPLADHARVVQEVERLTGGAGADRVIEAVGLQEPLDLAGQLTRVRGRLVVAGYHQDGMRQVNMQLWNWRGIDVINAHERDPGIALDGIRGAIQVVADGTLDPAPLYTHRFELARLDEALDTMRRRPDGFLKALVVT
jgi:threonine dehydrogenase-like Zn-dependent dehydrogenase